MEVLLCLFNDWEGPRAGQEPRHPSPVAGQPAVFGAFDFFGWGTGGCGSHWRPPALGLCMTKPQNPAQLARSLRFREISRVKSRLQPQRFPVERASQPQVPKGCWSQGRLGIIQLLPLLLLLHFLVSFCPGLSEKCLSQLETLKGQNCIPSI